MQDAPILTNVQGHLKIWVGYFSAGEVAPFSGALLALNQWFSLEILLLIQKECHH